MHLTSAEARVAVKGHVLSLTVGALLLGLCVTSCAVREGGFLSAYVRQEMVRPPGEEYKFVRGGVSRLVFAIENASDDIIVLRSCSIPGQLPDIDRWHGARYGSVEHRPLEDVWWYNGMAQQLSEPVFAMGVIPPGGDIKIERWAILKEASVMLEVAYHRLTPERARRYLYVETGHNDPVGSDSLFEHPADLSHAATSPGDINWHTVIFPEADTLDIESQTLTCTVSLREPPVGIEAAQAVVGEPIVDSVYCKHERAWVVQTDQGTSLVAGPKCIPLPEMDLLSFVVIDASYQTVRFMLPEAGYEEFTAQEDEKEEGRFAETGVTRVPHAGVRALLERVAANGHHIVVEAHDPTGLGMHFCLAVKQHQ